MRFAAIATMVSVSLLGATGPVCAQEPVDLDFLAGEWAITDASGAAVGSSVIEIGFPGAVLFERRTIGEHRAQPLWFVNTEDAGGWQQLFVAISKRVRAFDPRSANGEWPLVLGDKVKLKDGRLVEFRMTLERNSENESHRVLERSADDGATWVTVFDYRYRRTGPPAGQESQSP